MQNVNITVVSQLTGINENTLRAWERRYGLVKPSRSPDGRRLYSKSDIEKLTLLWKLVERGHLISNIASASVAQLRKMMEEFGDRGNQAEQLSLEPTLQRDSRLDGIIASLKKFDLHGVQRCLSELRFEHSPKQIVTKFCLPLLYEVGEQVADSRLSVAQEHLLSSLLRDYLGELYQSLSPYDYARAQRSTRVLLTTREGDLHEFGILLAAILCRVHGLETYYLGPNMPVTDLLEACEQFRIKILIVGFARLPPEKELISSSDFLRKVDRTLSKRVTILAGGSVDMAEAPISSGRKFVSCTSMVELDEYLAKLQI